MSLSDENMKNDLQDKFNGFEYPVSEHIWEDVKNHVPKKKKRRVFPFLLAFLIGASSLTGGMIWWDDFDNKAQSTNEKLVSNNDNKPVNKQKNKNHSNSNESSVLKNNASHDEIETTKDEKKVKNTTYKNNRSSNESKKNTKKINDNITKTGKKKEKNPKLIAQKAGNTKRESSMKKNSNNAYNISTSDKNNTNDKMNEKGNGHSENSGNSPINISNDKKQKNDHKNNQQVKNSVEEFESKGKDGLGDSNHNFNKSKEKIKGTRQEATNSKNNEAIKDSLEDNNPTQSQKDSSCINKCKCLDKFFITLSGGGSIYNNSLDMNNEKVEKARKNSEKTVLTFNGGIHVGYSFFDNMNITGGIRLKKYEKKYEGNFSKVITNTKVSDSFIVVTPSIKPPKHQKQLKNGDGLKNLKDTIHFYDTTTTKETIKNGHKGRQTYKYISFPIMFQYDIDLHNKVFVSPSLGITINRLISAEAKWVNPETLEKKEFSSNDFKKWTFSWRLGLNIGYKLNDKWSVSLSPGYSKSINSIYKNSNKVDEKPANFDANLGLSYSF